MPGRLCPPHRQYPPCKVKQSPMRSVQGEGADLNRLPYNNPIIGGSAVPESCGNEDHVHQLYLRAEMRLGEAECHKSKCIFPTLAHHCKSVLLLRKSKVFPRLSVASKSSLDAWGRFSSGLDPPDPDSCLFDCSRA